VNINIFVIHLRFEYIKENKNYFIYQRKSAENLVLKISSTRAFSMRQFHCHMSIFAVLTLKIFIIILYIEYILLLFSLYIICYDV